MSRPVWMFGTLLLGALGCGDLEARDDGAPMPQPSAPGPTGSAGASVEQTLRIDATSSAQWVYLDLESAQQAPEPTQVPGWDIALQRMNLKLNGGVYGGAGVEASLIMGQPFPAVSAAPRGGYDTDRVEGKYFLAGGDTGWYDYDGSSHRLSPRPFVYALKSDQGNYFKLAVLDYYNEARSGGHVTLKWATLEAPAGPTTQRAADAVDETTSASKPDQAD